MFVVVDTNVLMSHMAAVEKMADELAGAALEARSAGAPQQGRRSRDAAAGEDFCALLLLHWQC